MLPGFSHHFRRLLAALCGGSWFMFQALGVEFLDSFTSGVGSWITPPGWILAEQADQNVVFRGDSVPDLFARRMNVSLGRSWRLEVDLHFRRLYADGQRGLAGFALYPSLDSGVQLEVNVGDLNHRSVQIDAQWFNPETSTWRNVSQTDWISHASSTYRLHVFRPFDSDHLVLKLTSTNGFRYLAETAPFPVEVLDRMTVFGLRVNASQVEFDNLRLVTPYSAPAPPVLLEQPQSLTVGRGTPATLRVMATGPGPLTYQWWRGKVILPNRTNDFFAIPSATPVHAGTYTVVVSNGERTIASDPAVLAVIDGYLRLPLAGALSPDRIALEVRVPKTVAYRLQRSGNLSDWVDWSEGVGSGGSVTVDVPRKDGARWEGFRLLFP